MNKMIETFDTEQLAWEWFGETDPFNGNFVEGYLSYSPGAMGWYYGALKIEKVNYVETPQDIILGTPKLHYPFSREGKWQFPSADSIRSYRKYDGTNIFLYRYFDEKGNRHLGFKVRLFPFLRGKFVKMWHDIIDKYDNQFRRLFDMNWDIAGFSFELYGYHNTHLISYPDTPLDIAMLFGRRKDGHIVTLDKINSLGIPQADHICDISEDYIFHYQAAQNELGENLSIIDDDGKYGGDEGHVWYLKVERRRILSYVQM